MRTAGSLQRRLRKGAPAAPAGAAVESASRAGCCAYQRPSSPLSSSLIENFFENQFANNSKSEIPGGNSLAGMLDSRVLQRGRRARQQDVLKFRKKLGKIEEELSKIVKKRGALLEKERVLKSKRVKLVSRMRQRNIPVELFNKPAGHGEECDDEQMELRAVEKLVELSRSQWSS